MLRRRLILLSFIVTVLPEAIWGQGLEVIGHTLHKGPFNQIAKIGEYMYCSANNLTHILAIDSIALPKLTRYFNFKFNDIKIRGNFAYAAISDSGLFILDITDPVNPFLRSRVSGGISRVIVNGDYAYVLSQSVGLSVINISDPNNPNPVGICNITNGFSISLSGNYIYLSAQDSGFYIIDISSAYNPTAIGRIQTEYPAYGIEVDSEYIYVATVNSDFWPPDCRGDIITYRLINEINLLEIGHYRTQGNCPNMFVISDGLAFVHDGWDIALFDLSNPAEIAPIGSIEANDHILDYEILGDTVIISTEGIEAAGIQLFDISNPTEPHIIGSYDTGAPVAVCIADNKAYVADNTRGGLKILDIADSMNPRLVGSCNTAGVRHDISVHGDYAYITSGNSGLQIFNVSDPFNPVLLTTYPGSGSAWKLYISGNYAYIGYSTYISEFNGLKIIDISDPRNPSIVGSYEIHSTGGIRGIQVQGNYAYLADTRTGLLVLNISDPSQPVLSGIYQLDNLMMHDVAVRGNYAYAAVWEEGLYVIDITNNSSPILAGTCPIHRGAGTISLVGDYCYITNIYGIHVIDIAHPTDPLVVDSCATPSLSLDSAPYGEIVYVADWRSLVILSTPYTAIGVDRGYEARSFTLSSNHPNPFNARTSISYSLPSESQVTFEAFDVTGRKITAAALGSQAAGKHVYIWDAGEISSGVYFYRIKTGNLSESRKCLLLK
jgi:hypothetical protein